MLVEARNHVSPAFRYRKRDNFRAKKRSVQGEMVSQNKKRGGYIASTKVNLGMVPSRFERESKGAWLLVIFLCKAGIHRGNNGHLEINHNKVGYGI